MVPAIAKPFNYQHQNQHHLNIIIKKENNPNNANYVTKTYAKKANPNPVRLNLRRYRGIQKI